MSSYEVSWRGKECIKTFISMFSAVWDQKQMPFILLLGFLGDCFELYVHTNVHLQLNTSVHPFFFPSQSNNLQQARHY